MNKIPVQVWFNASSALDTEILKYLKISDNESWREKRKNTVKTLGRKGDESERGEKREGES